MLDDEHKGGEGGGNDILRSLLCPIFGSLSDTLYPYRTGDRAIAAFRELHC